MSAVPASEKGNFEMCSSDTQVFPYFGKVSESVKSKDSYVALGSPASKGAITGWPSLHNQN
jgi:hypothetical protein